MFYFTGYKYLTTEMILLGVVFVNGKHLRVAVYYVIVGLVTITQNCLLFLKMNIIW